MKNLCVSFNMHPRWLFSTTLAEFLEPLQIAGLNGMEFLLDPMQPEWEQFADLMQDCQNAGLRLSFHAPYSQAFSLQGFASAAHRASIEDRFSPFFDLAESFSRTQKDKPTVVVHGARSKNSTRQELVEDTLQFLAWAGERFQGLSIALENLNQGAGGEMKVGETREEVLQVVRSVHYFNVGICWDMGHDYLQGNIDPPGEEWLKEILHIHIHDIGEDGRDHYPLVYDRVPVRPWLGALLPAGRLETICLEVKGHQLNGWGLERCSQSLVQSLLLIQEAIS